MSQTSVEKRRGENEKRTPHEERERGYKRLRKVCVDGRSDCSQDHATALL